MHTYLFSFYTAAVEFRRENGGKVEVYVHKSSVLSVVPFSGMAHIHLSRIGLGPNLFIILVSKARPAAAAFPFYICFYIFLYIYIPFISFLTQLFVCWLVGW
jgi:hypothetical protein